MKSALMSWFPRWPPEAEHPEGWLNHWRLVAERVPSGGRKAPVEAVTVYFLGIQNHWTMTVAMRLKNTCSLEGKL